MPDLHPSAVIDGDVDLADDVVIGPGCVLSGGISIGAGTRLLGNVYLQGPLRMGADNIVYPFSCLGFAPQHARYDPSTPGRGLVIGSGNTLREQVSIHRAFTDERPTTVGDRNLFMVGSHLGHDGLIGNDCTIANEANLGGHVEVGDRANVGGLSAIHQFCRIGRNAMLTGGMGTGHDVPPFFMLTGFNSCGSLNLVGLRRSGATREAIETVRWVFKVLYRQRLTLKSAMRLLREREDDPVVQEYIEFIEGSSRGICRGPGRGRL